MIALTSPYLWYSARATGTVALVLLTFTVVLGTLVATRVGGNAIGRFEINEIHRSVSAITLIFVAIHVGVTVIDSYVPIGVLAALIPGTSPYRRWPVALGTVTIALMLAIWLSSLAKERIRHSTWRFIHWMSWAAFVTAVVHGFLAGTDSHRAWSLIVTGACVAVTVIALIWRVALRPDRAAGRTAHSPLKGPTTAQRTQSRPSSDVPRGHNPRAVPPKAPPRAPR